MLLVALIVLENRFSIVFQSGMLTTGVNAIGLFCTSVTFGIALLDKLYNASVYIEVSPPFAMFCERKVSAEAKSPDN